MYKLGSDLISCLLQYSNPCAMLNQNKNFCIVTNLESHPKKNIAVLIRVFLREKKSADVSYLFTRSQLLISPPLYYTTYISIYSQIKIVWLLHYILPTHVHQVCIKTKPHILLKIIFKWKQSWMIGASLLLSPDFFWKFCFWFFYYIIITKNKNNLLRRRFLCKYYIYIFFLIKKHPFLCTCHPRQIIV